MRKSSYSGKFNKSVPTDFFVTTMILVHLKTVVMMMVMTMMMTARLSESNLTTAIILSIGMIT